VIPSIVKYGGLPHGISDELELRVIRGMPELVIFSSHAWSRCLYTIVLKHA